MNVLRVIQAPPDPVTAFALEPDKPVQHLHLPSTHFDFESSAVHVESAEHAEIGLLSLEGTLKKNCITNNTRLLRRIIVN